MNLFVFFQSVHWSHVNGASEITLLVFLSLMGAFAIELNGDYGVAYFRGKDIPVIRDLKQEGFSTLSLTDVSVHFTDLL